MRDFPLTAIVQKRLAADQTPGLAQSPDLHEGTDLLVMLELLHTASAKSIMVRGVVDTGSPFTIIPRRILDVASKAGMTIRRDKHKEPARTFDGQRVLLDRIDSFAPSIVAMPLDSEDDARQATFRPFETRSRDTLRLSPGRMRLLCPTNDADRTEAIIGTDMFVNIAKFAPVRLAVSWSKSRTQPGESIVEARGMIQAK